MEKFAVIGDSHSMYFRQYEKINSIIGAKWKINDYLLADINSSTIRGLSKENSTLNVAKRVNQIVHQHRLKSMVFGLGQVDVEFGCYYRKIVKNENFTDAEFISETVDIYNKYLSKFIRNYDARIVIKGINPTVLINQDASINHIGHNITMNIKDVNQKQYYKDKLAEQLPDYDKRFALNNALNIELRNMAKQLGATYFDLWQQTIDPATQMVYLEYLPAFEDHHLADSIEVRKLHYDKLYETMSGLFSA